MFFIAGHKNNITDFKAAPFLIPEYLAGTAMHEYFVFPGMGMFGSMSTGCNLAYFGGQILNSDTTLKI
jgi:hypothetical protein